jgi:hypothetical protein
MRLRFIFQGREKAIRGGVNESQSKFLTGTLPMSQIRPNASLF